jgi:hypothetical protein
LIRRKVFTREMTFTHKIVHANDSDEIWVQNKTSSKLNIESNDLATANAVVGYVEDKMLVIICRGNVCFQGAPRPNTFDMDAVNVTIAGNMVNVFLRMDFFTHTFQGGESITLPTLNSKIPKPYARVTFSTSVPDLSLRIDMDGQIRAVCPRSELAVGSLTGYVSFCYIGDPSTVEEEEFG